MNLPDRHLLFGMTLGAVCATALAAIGPGAVLPVFGEEVATGFDTDDLVKFEDVNYIVEHEDWVSTEPVSTSRVKKIEMGRVTYVDITTTSTGTYSTDAMFSDHIQYPGISVEEAPWPHNRGRNRFSYLSGGNWYSFSSTPGRSYFHFRSNGTAITNWGSMTCVSGRGFSVC